VNAQAERPAEPDRSSLLLGSHSGDAIRHLPRSSQSERVRTRDAPAPARQRFNHV